MCSTLKRVGLLASAALVAIGFGLGNANCGHAAAKDVPLPPARPQELQQQPDTYGDFAGDAAVKYCIEAVERNSPGFSEKDKGTHRIICAAAFIAGVMWREGKDPREFLAPADEKGE